MSRCCTLAFCLSKQGPLLVGCFVWHSLVSQCWHQLGASSACAPLLYENLEILRLVVLNWAHTYHFKLIPLAELRAKARILVPGGVCLMGAADETGLLRDGCVFLQVSACVALPALCLCKVLHDCLS